MSVLPQKLLLIITTRSTEQQQILLENILLYNLFSQHHRQKNLVFNLLLTAQLTFYSPDHRRNSPTLYALTLANNNFSGDLYNMPKSTLSAY